MAVKEKEKLPEAKKITTKLDLDEAKECLRYLPETLEKVRGKIREAIEHVDFWNFLRNCEYLEAVRADFHFTGLLNPPAWSLYCKHPENKRPCEKEKLRIEDLPEEVIDKITGPCDKQNCPIYE
ncbi:MAG: hypothetical protein AOA66_0732 [Candidatus Bathyarchaeota archaeon BA2]|nr:MAG: hypothetical protein AOA66_0732 [Candidatus Bathyarchaeota archaeon BA2]